MLKHTLTLSISLTMLAACADDLMPVDDDITTKTVVTEEEAAGLFKTTIDASNRDNWVYFSFATGAEVKPENPDTSTDWDIAVRRFSIKVNGGVSGPADVLVSAITDQSFGAIMQAPQDGYASDEEATGDPANPDFIGGDEAAFIFFAPHAASENGWYLYDTDDPTHTLMAAPVVYALRAADGSSFFKMQILEYYNVAGEAGHVAFRWTAVTPPDNPIVGGKQPKPKPGVELNAADGWTYVSFSSGGIVEIANPRESSDWDVAMWRTMWITNSATNGPGSSGARWAPEGAVYAELAESPTIGFAPDEVLPVPGPPGAGDFTGSQALNEWYNYDTVTHAVSPKEEVLLIRGAKADYTKLRVLEYDEGVYRVEFANLPAKPETVSLEIETTDQIWTYVNLRTGQTVEPFDPSDSLDWDIGLSGDKVRTNGGTSGIGEAGARAMGLATLGEMNTAPAEGYAADVVLTSTSGVDLYSGNEVLGTWLDNVGTEVFSVRAADGTFLKAQLKSFDAGRYTVDYAYAGPGSRGF